MRRASHVAVVFVAFVVLVGTARAADWKVGDKWTYRNEGPRPYADPSAKIQGDRTTEVTAIRGEGDEKRTLLRNVWGTADPNPTIAYVDANDLIHQIDVQGMGSFRFDPPVPALWQLEVGEQKTIKCKVDFSMFTLTIEYVARRLPDETVTVPAGRFENCRHITILTTTTTAIAPTTKSKMDYWYHPSVKHFVKDVTVTNFDSDNAYTTTSLLKAFSSTK